MYRPQYETQDQTWGYQQHKKTKSQIENWFRYFMFCEHDK